jgi:hypothetical protein
MKKILLASLMLTSLFGCEKEEIEPRVDKMQLLSGGTSSGKKWEMVSFVTISNYFTWDINKFDSTDSWSDYPESIKDNVFTIYPDGKAEVDEGAIHYNEDTPQIFKDLQTWTLISNQDSVVIYDAVGLPSIHSTWGIVFTEDKIELTHQELDYGFKGSSLTQKVEFKGSD